MRMDYRSKNGKTIIQNELQYNIKLIKTIMISFMIFYCLLYHFIRLSVSEKYGYSLDNRYQ
jgi:hypothetical protein